MIATDELPADNGGVEVPGKKRKRHKDKEYGIARGIDFQGQRDNDSVVKLQNITMLYNDYVYRHAIH